MMSEMEFWDVIEPIIYDNTDDVDYDVIIEKLYKVLVGGNIRRI